MTSPSLRCVRAGLTCCRATCERLLSWRSLCVPGRTASPGGAGLGFCFSVSTAKVWVSTDRAVGTAGLFPENLGLTKRWPWLFISSCLREQERLVASVSPLCRRPGEGSRGHGEFHCKQRPRPGEGGGPAAEDAAITHRGVASSG